MGYEQFFHYIEKLISQAAHTWEGSDFERGTEVYRYIYIYLHIYVDLSNTTRNRCIWILFVSSFFIGQLDKQGFLFCTSWEREIIRKKAYTRI